MVNSTQWFEQHYPIPSEQLAMNDFLYHTQNFELVINTNASCFTNLPLTLIQPLPHTYTSLISWSHESSDKSLLTIYYRFHKLCRWILNILCFKLHCPRPPLLDHSMRHWMLLKSSSWFCSNFRSTYHHWHNPCFWSFCRGEEPDGHIHFRSKIFF